MAISHASEDVRNDSKERTQFNSLANKQSCQVSIFAELGTDA